VAVRIAVGVSVMLALVLGYVAGVVTGPLVLPSPTPTPEPPWERAALHVDAPAGAISLRNRLQEGWTIERADTSGQGTTYVLRRDPRMPTPVLPTPTPVPREFFQIEAGVKEVESGLLAAFVSDATTADIAAGSVLGALGRREHLRDRAVLLPLPEDDDGVRIRDRLAAADASLIQFEAATVVLVRSTTSATERATKHDEGMCPRSAGRCASCRPCRRR
jgi:hypothetical protein